MIYLPLCLSQTSIIFVNVRWLTGITSRISLKHKIHLHIFPFRLARQKVPQNKSFHFEIANSKFNIQQYISDGRHRLLATKLLRVCMFTNTYFLHGKIYHFPPSDNDPCITSHHSIFISTFSDTARLVACVCSILFQFFFHIFFLRRTFCPSIYVCTYRLVNVKRRSSFSIHFYTDANSIHSPQL